MNTHEIERIAAAMNQLRPDWPKASLTTLLSRAELRDRPRRDVMVALGWVACESDTKTPARVLEHGPWWVAAAVEARPNEYGHRHTAKVYGSNEGDPRTVCGICGLERAECERRAATNGHEFIARIECLPPTEVGALGKRGKCLAGPPDAPCQLLTGHDGEHEPTRDRPEPRPKPAPTAEVAAVRASIDGKGVGTGAGGGASGQDTGAAWDNRSEDCPEAPAQAHPLVQTDTNPAAVRSQITSDEESSDE